MTDVNMMRLLREWTPFEYDRKKLLEEKERNGGHFMMKGILQKADVLNQNGRIYPRDVLEKEVENYQKFIRENRALGECVPEGTEVLTADGWRDISEMCIDDDIMTLDTSTNEMVLQPVTAKVDREFEGELIRIHSRTVDMCVTPNHKVLLWDRCGTPYTLTAQEVAQRIDVGDSSFRHSGIMRSGAVWKGDDYDTVDVAGCTVDAALWSAFLGIYIAEGHCNGIKSGKRDNPTVVITQLKPDSRAKIGELVKKLPFEFKEIRQGFAVKNREL